MLVENAFKEFKVQREGLQGFRGVVTSNPPYHFLDIYSPQAQTLTVSFIKFEWHGQHSGGQTAGRAGRLPKCCEVKPCNTNFDVNRPEAQVQLLE